MSAARKLMDEVVQLGGRLSLNGDKMRVAAPSPLPDELLAKLRELKPAIVKELAPPVPTSNPERLQRETETDERRASVVDLLDQMQERNDRRRDWHAQPVEGWREGQLTIRNIVRDETNVVRFRKGRA